MNTFIKLIYLSILVSAPAHAMQNNTDLGKWLIKAARANDHKEIERLIEAGAPVNYTEENGMPALMLAAAHDNLNCINALIAARAQVNMADNYGWTALLLATKYRPLFIKTLLAAGARVNQATDAGWTALKHAVFVQDQPTCELLIDAMLWIPNKDQKAGMITFLGVKSRARLFPRILDDYLRNQFKVPWLAMVYEDNKKNFTKSIAYQEITKAPEGDIKKALLEKYNAAATTSNSQSGV